MKGKILLVNFYNAKFKSYDKEISLKVACEMMKASNKFIKKQIDSKKIHGYLSNEKTYKISKQSIIEFMCKRDYQMNIYGLKNLVAPEKELKQNQNKIFLNEELDLYKINLILKYRELFKEYDDLVNISTACRMLGNITEGFLIKRIQRNEIISFKKFNKFHYIYKEALIEFVISDKYQNNVYGLKTIIWGVFEYV